MRRLRDFLSPNFVLNYCCGRVLQFNRVSEKEMFWQNRCHCVHYPTRFFYQYESNFLRGSFEYLIHENSRIEDFFATQIAFDR